MMTTMITMMTVMMMMMMVDDGWMTTSLRVLPEAEERNVLQALRRAFRAPGKDSDGSGAQLQPGERLSLE